jgi:hypothetical protein
MSRIPLRRSCYRPPVAAWLVTLLLAILSQSAHTTAGEVSALRVRFPEHVSRVLGDQHRHRFVERDGWFVLDPQPMRGAGDIGESASRRRTELMASFPVEGSGDIEFKLPDGFTVRVREVGVRGRGRPDAGALAYPHRSGAVFWSSDGTGYEEWLLLDHPREDVVARWEVIGASLVQRGDRVLILDRDGRARLAVSAPKAYANSGTTVKTMLRARDNVIALTLDAVDAAVSHVLVDPSWDPVGPLGFSRVGNTATLLPTGRVLVAGGFGTQASPANYAELYDPATGVWSPAAPMNSFKADHTATLLRNGKVLVAGGFDANVKTTKTAELYDPVTGIWSPTGSLTHARTRHSATLLADGRVLIAGGTGVSGDLTSCEIYHPGSGTWTNTGSLNVKRSSHVSVRLSSGKVLAAGGRPTKSAELFDPQTGSWTFTGSSDAVHFFGHTATLLRNGRVLVAGGTGPGGSPDEQSAVELYFPATGTWISTAALPVPRVDHTATLLPNGNVLVAGGYTGTTDEDARQTQVYMVTSGVWQSTGSLKDARFGHTALLLPDSRVLIAGGKWNPSAPKGTEIFIYPNLAEWDPVGPMTTPRRFHTATALPNGKVLIVGGQDAALQTLNTAELYDPAAGTSQATAAMSSPRQRHAATLLPNGKVLVVGGSVGSTFHLTAELYDAATETWTPTGSLASAREAHTATLLADGRVLIVGGNDANGALQSGELYDAAAGTWSPATGALGAPRSRHTATLLRNNKALVVGGNAGFATAEIYDLAGGSWSPTGPLPADHNTGHSATLLPNGRVLVAGGLSGATTLAQASLLNPVSGTWSATDTMFKSRTEHTATLLPSGRVLLAGGNDPSDRASLMAFTDEYEPATGKFRLTNLILIRQQATATLLSTGQVLLAGGNDTYYLAPAPPITVLDSADVYDEGRGAPASATPSLNPLSPGVANPGAVLFFSGTGLTRPHEASSGRGASNSATNYPLLVLEREDNEAVSYAPVFLWGVSLFGLELAAATLPTDLQPGWHFARVIVNGVASASRPIRIQ